MGGMDKHVTCHVLPAYNRLLFIRDDFIILSDLLLTMAYMLGRMFSPVGRNVHMCCCKYGVPVQCRPNPSKVISEKLPAWCFMRTEGAKSVLYDMVLERESTQPFLTRDEIDTIIGNICSNYF